MGAKVYLYSELKELANGVDVVDVRGSTIGECLADLVSQLPQMKSILFDKDGKLSPEFLVSINLNSMYPEQMANPVVDNDAIYIVPFVYGG